MKLSDDRATIAMLAILAILAWREQVEQVPCSESRKVGGIAGSEDWIHHGDRTCGRGVLKMSFYIGE